MLAATAKRYVRAAVFQLSFAFRLSLFCLTSIVFRVFWVIEQTGLCLLQQYVSARSRPVARAFQFGQKKFRLDSILTTESIFRFDSIWQSAKFAACTLIFK